VISDPSTTPADPELSQVAVLLTVPQFRELTRLANTLGRSHSEALVFLLEAYATMPAPVPVPVPGWTWKLGRWSDGSVLAALHDDEHQLRALVGKRGSVTIRDAHGGEMEHRTALAVDVWAQRGERQCFDDAVAHIQEYYHSQGIVVQPPPCPWPETTTHDQAAADDRPTRPDDRPG
jgi:hypothetical protein